jgi:hypothetical protein
MKSEHPHQYHEVGTTTSTTRSWNNIINNTKLEHQHQQHEAGKTSSTTRSWNLNIYMWQQNEARASTTSVVL